MKLKSRSSPTFFFQDFSGYSGSVKGWIWCPSPTPHLKQKKSYGNSKPELPQNVTLETGAIQVIKLKWGYSDGP